MYILFTQSFLLHIIFIFIFLLTTIIIYGNIYSATSINYKINYKLYKFKGEINYDNQYQ